MEPAEWEPPLREPEVQLIIWSLKKFSTPIHKILKETWKHLTSLKLWKRSQIPHPSPRVASISNRTKTNHHWLNHQQTIHVYTHTHTHTHKHTHTHTCTHYVTPRAREKTEGSSRTPRITQGNLGLTSLPHSPLTNTRNKKIKL